MTESTNLLDIFDTTWCIDSSNLVPFNGDLTGHNDFNFRIHFPFHIYPLCKDILNINEVDLQSLANGNETHHFAKNTIMKLKNHCE
jgi:hypothetical protein